MTGVLLFVLVAWLFAFGVSCLRRARAATRRDIARAPDRGRAAELPIDTLLRGEKKREAIRRSRRLATQRH